MKHRKTAAFVLILALVHPAPAFAVFGVADTADGLLAELVALEAKQTFESMPQIVAHLITMMEFMNETAGAAKYAQEAYQWARDVTWKDILLDAKAGLYNAFPEMEKIEFEGKDLHDNIKGLGDGKFFSVHTRGDSRTRQTAKKLVEHGFRSAVWPHMFPEAFNYKALETPNPIDVEIEKRFIESGMALERQLRKTAYGAMVGEMEQLVKHAERTNRTDLLAEARGAQANIQSANALGEQLDMMKLEEARKQVAETMSGSAAKAMKKSLRENVEILNRGPGAIQ